MTEITFHFNVPNKVAYACRLLRKAAATQVRAVVTGSPPVLQSLDRALWSVAPHSFVAHCLVGDEALMRDICPVVLAEIAVALPHRQLLVNVGSAVPQEFGQFERMIEIVGRDDEADRAQARVRWRHYADRGYAIAQHDLASMEAV